MAKPTIPVVIVSGYLGAGKTTLIRAFLTNPQGLRATVLVNDFGQVNIDAELIAETGADTIALTNGCACCSIGDDLLGAANAAMTTQPDLLVIEASGVAQPARIARLLHGVSGTASARCLAVVNGARAQHLARDKFVGQLFKQQIDQAEGISLNRKADVLPAQLDNRAQYASLYDFICATETVQEGAPPGIGEAEVNFAQSIHQPPAMAKADMRSWLLEICPTLHRAKGVFPMKETQGSTIMARVDYVQGDLSIVPLPDRACDAFGQIVMIAPKGEGAPSSAPG